MAGGEEGHLAPNQGRQSGFSVGQSFLKGEAINGFQSSNQGLGKKSADELKFVVAAG